MSEPHAVRGLAIILLGICAGSASAEDFGLIDEENDYVPPDAAKMPDDEYKALMALWTATSGSSWVHASNNHWMNQGDPCYVSSTGVDLKKWSGLKCDKEGRVTGIMLHDKGLKGTIPSEIGNLARLTKLTLSHNSLSGTMPKELGKLKLLSRLSISSNSITGTIPNELSSLDNLEGLHVDTNTLTGTIPDFSNLGLIEAVTLHTNSLTGTCPPTIGKVSKSTMRNLVMYKNPKLKMAGDTHKSKDEV